MLKRSNPGVDRSIAPEIGSTREGQPLSYNRAPSPDLAPWIARVYVAKVNAPAEHQLNCGLFNDTAFIRIQLRGEWKAETVRGPLLLNRAALFFGPHTHRMPVSVKGSYTSLGVSLRPGTCNALKGPKVGDHLDEILPFSTDEAQTERVFAMFEPDASPEEWACALENIIREQVELTGGKVPDPVSASFEALSFTDPSANIADFARRIGVEQRRLERIVRRDFGMPPKQVLRRARALDMASHLRGVADHEEAEALALRYYDQSHLIREFDQLFGMSPTQFVAKPQPLLTSTLESRQARRLEALSRITPGEVRPWQ